MGRVARDSMGFYGSPMFFPSASQSLLKGIGSLDSFSSVKVPKISSRDRAIMRTLPFYEAFLETNEQLLLYTTPSHWFPFKNFYALKALQPSFNA